MPIKRPSIFDIFENFSKSFPFSWDRDMEDWLQEPFELMIKRFEETVPSEFKDLVKKSKLPPVRSADMVLLSMDSATLQNLGRSQYFRSSAISDHPVEEFCPARVVSH
jgi:hypothetical protein